MNDTWGSELKKHSKEREDAIQRARDEAWAEWSIRKEAASYAISTIESGVKAKVADGEQRSRITNDLKAKHRELHVRVRGAEGIARQKWEEQIKATVERAVEGEMTKRMLIREREAGRKMAQEPPVRKKKEECHPQAAKQTGWQDLAGWKERPHITKGWMEHESCCSCSFCS